MHTVWFHQNKAPNWAKLYCSGVAYDKNTGNQENHSSEKAVWQLHLMEGGMGLLVGMDIWGFLDVANVFSVKVVTNMAVSFILKV